MVAPIFVCERESVLPLFSFLISNDVKQTSGNCMPGKRREERMRFGSVWKVRGKDEVWVCLKGESPVASVKAPWGGDKWGDKWGSGWGRGGLWSSVCARTAAQGMNSWIPEFLSCCCSQSSCRLSKATELARRGDRAGDDRGRGRWWRGEAARAPLVREGSQGALMGTAQRARAEGAPQKRGQKQLFNDPVWECGRKH